MNANSTRLVVSLALCVLGVCVFSGLSCPMDTDMDGVSDDTDNCLMATNSDQADADGDGVGDACDLCPGADDTADANGDGVADCLVTAAKVISAEPPDTVNAGAVAAFEFELTDGTGHIWDIDDQGEVKDGSNPPLGTDDAFDRFVELFIDSTQFPAQAGGDLEDGREIVLGPESMSNLDVTRKIFVSATKGFARWLDILENNTATDITVDVSTRGGEGSDEGNSLVIASSNGNPTLENGDTWWVNCQDFPDDPCIASFFCGATPTKTQDDINHEYGMVTVPAGKRLIIVTYMSMSSPDFANVVDFFEAVGPAAQKGQVDLLAAFIASLEGFPCVDECFLEGISTAELNDIRTCGGAVCVTGRAGSVAGGAVVTVTDTNTGDSRMVTAAADGSWRASLIGDSGDIITFAADDGTSGTVNVP